jgi:hypothetical protein
MGLQAGQLPRPVTEAFRALESIDPHDLRVGLEGAPVGTAGQDPESHPFLRRWDQRAPLIGNGAPTLAGDNALHVVEGDDHWIDLEDGVQIRFAPGGRLLAHPGTHWTGGCAMTDEERGTSRTPASGCRRASGALGARIGRRQCRGPALPVPAIGLPTILTGTDRPEPRV